MYVKVKYKKISETTTYNWVMFAANYDQQADKLTPQGYTIISVREQDHPYLYDKVRTCRCGC